jgi:glycosyltransferase involved in cell wall biosynthesis
VISSGENGLLVPAADPDRLADAMLAMAVQPALRETLSANARSSVRRDFSVESWMQKMAAVYRAAALKAGRA